MGTECESLTRRIIRSHYKRRLKEDGASLPAAVSEALLLSRWVWCECVRGVPDMTCRSLSLPWGGAAGTEQECFLLMT